MSTLSEKAHNLPPTPGVYLFKDAAGRVLYVGKAKSLSQRVRNYLAGDLAESKTRELMSRAADLDTILTDTEAEALLLESTLVRQHRPHYNILLKDDKSFPYVRVSVQEEWPRVSVTRQVRNDGARYLGPYTDVKLLRRTLREIRPIFPLRSCRNFEDYRRADRPCLYYHIHRCVGPCTRRAGVDPEDYRRRVDALLLFLSGRDDELTRRLRDEMEEAAAGRRYERAAERRDQLDLLRRARVPQKVVGIGRGDTDVVGLARQERHAAIAVLVLRGGRVVGKESRTLDHAEALGEPELLESSLSQHYLPRRELPRRIVLGAMPAGAEVLAEALARRAGHPVELAAPTRGRERRLVAAAERNAAHALEDDAARAAGRRARHAPEMLELQRVLGLPSPPFRIVCFDISNFGAEGAVAAVVASEGGRPRRGLYRRMRIRRQGPDDFAMIAEAVTRYWTRVESGELPRPDLVLVDGGPGQLSAARRALDGAGTRPVALLGLAKREETVVREHAPPLRLPLRSRALRALQRVRDEAHRFGLSYHRLVRGRARLASEIDGVPGVGPKRRRALLRAFGSAAALRGVAPAEIARRAGVPAALAARIAAHLEATAPDVPAPPAEARRERKPA